MEIAMIGLGRMGSNMSRRLIRAGHRCLVYDRSNERREALRQEGAQPLEHLDEIKEALSPPRAVWLMLPAGASTESTIQRLCEILEPGDVIIDGGNTCYKDDIRRARELDRYEIRYVDVGTSGGIWGLERGYCLMIGGDRKAVESLESIFKSLAPGHGSVAVTENRADHRSTADAGYLYCGLSGSGHFVKMIHNGIEYGMMQALAEGFDILKGADSSALPLEQHYKLDLREIAELWRRGSVISSWLLDLIAISLNRSPELEEFEGVVQDSGEGRWTLQAAIEEGIPANVIASSLFVRFRSRKNDSYAEKLLSAMRNEFGGHTEPKTSGSKIA